MDLSLSETQKHLSDSVHTFLSRLPKQEMPAAPKSGPDDVWKALGEDLGLLSLLLTEEQGGFGGRGDDLLVVMEAMGEHLLTQPFMEVAVSAVALLSLCEGAQAESLLRALVAGQSHIVPILDVGLIASPSGSEWQITGNAGLVYPATASSFLVKAKHAENDDVLLFSINATDAALRPVATIDERWAAEVRFNQSDATLLLRGKVAAEAVEAAKDMALAALCAEASGVLKKLLDDTVAFTKERRQFGQPISRFQVLQHRMADMFMQYEMARSAAVLACLSLDKPASERSLATSAAKVIVSDACRFIGQNAVQLHGGLGMSAEIEMTRWFKRATVIEQQLGSRDFHIDRYRNAA